LARAAQLVGGMDDPSTGTDAAPERRKKLVKCPARPAKQLHHEKNFTRAATFCRTLFI
jgi:hypothetical protein